MEDTKVNIRQQIRAKYRQKRNLLSAQQQASGADKILSVCLESTSLVSANNVACYLANDGEVSPSKIINYCRQHNKRVLLPVLHPFTKGHLLFVDYQLDSPMRANRYGIQQPIVTTANLCPLEKIDLIMAPLVAFDLKGNRLGMGGGYYDRTLAPILRDTLATKLIGLAHNCQQAPELPTDGWDIPLQGIVTPERFFSVS